ncbi:MAG: PilT protein-like protein [Tardiphaga sp.]|uniref:type II toxin-antitoxin system VapC family toxin n=1 Tax=Tardiphaga sp. TaxID=1926292 RepID=UPI002621273B|nr:type II toxin-antitoxin system VapC family toxin [Tardiphaga sp.]MDB5501521.1 PilT protein-like protein [Tardiphaga sp.]
MTSWLLDTNIVSQFAPMADGRLRADMRLTEWIQQNQNILFLSVITVVEITAGIEKLRRAGSTRRVPILEKWFGGMTDLYGERILPVDTKVGRIAGILTDQAYADGISPGVSDILIAATASAHGHGLLTGNIKHFEPLRLGVPLLNPLAQVPADPDS